MHDILISVGSNIEREKNTQAGLSLLSAHFMHMQLSQVYESEAVGFTGHHFYNLVVQASTHLSIDDVCLLLKDIEDKQGRVRGDPKFASRTLDLDLLTYDNIVCSVPVVLPREEILYNAFVLRPLADLVPLSKHPVVGKTYQQLWQEYDQSQQHLWPVDFTWSKP